MSPQRVNFFKGQLLRVKDFKDEQEYHVEMMRMHHRYLHTWGIINGLRVNAVRQTISIEAGNAISANGDFISLSKTLNIEDSEFPSNKFHVVVMYDEKMAEPVEEAGIKGYSRIIETGKVDLVSSPDRDSHVVLAKVIVKSDGIKIDGSGRRSSGLAVTSETGEKLSIYGKLYEKEESGLFFDAPWAEFAGRLLTKNLKVTGTAIFGNDEDDHAIFNSVIHPRIKPNKPLPSNRYPGRKLQIAGDVEFQEILSTPDGMIVSAGKDISLISNSGVYIKTDNPGANNLGGHLIVEKDLRVLGKLNAKTKQFVIDHPTNHEKDLQHSTLEGPEIGVYYRGESQLINGKTTIVLPEYFEALTHAENRTVLITPKCDPGENKTSALAASAVRNGQFSVTAIDDNNKRQRFYWEVKAVRSDVPHLDVEVVKTTDTLVKK
ncbi:hypothetical protein [Candidatus Uabimicrobium amorphum]|uniref:Uncharacterized protein n=1 Tax=Uabimicrobium amorphum TaxID=2596890 RepID=A0A5S9IUY3_UABAM|nr:hypothetical protein [Candidatus Uabimicrobium amorphum]BBM87981.1 hypothetical protein UABAM_06397 [Candidatus Uabimicrobium amorphum]